MSGGGGNHVELNRVELGCLPALMDHVLREGRLPSFQQMAGETGFSVTRIKEVIGDLVVKGVLGPVPEKVPPALRGALQQDAANRNMSAEGVIPAAPSWLDGLPALSISYPAAVDPARARKTGARVLRAGVIAAAVLLLIARVKRP